MKRFPEKPRTTPVHASALPRGVALGCKVLVAGCLVAWLVLSKQISWEVLQRVINGPSPLRLTLLSLGCVFLAQFCATWRLVILLRSARFSVGMGAALAVNFIGALTGVILPGQAGGDVVRVLYLCGHAEARPGRVATTVIIDRVVGLYSLLLFSSLALGVAWLFSWLPEGQGIVWLVGIPTAIITGGATFAALILFHLRRYHTMLACHLPPVASDFLQTLATDMLNPRALCAAVALSLMSHALVVISFWNAAELLNEHVSIAAHFTLSPLAMSLNAVPVTPGGFGVTESAFTVLYGWVGSKQGGTIALLGRLLQYLTYVLGGVPAMLITQMPLLSRRDRADRRQDTLLPPGHGAPSSTVREAA